MFMSAAAVLSGVTSDIIENGRLDWSTTILAAAMLSTPAWLPSLKDASDIAGAAAPLLGAGLIILKAYYSWREHKDSKENGESPAKRGERALDGISAGLGRLASASGRVAWAVAGVVGIAALLALLFSGSAKASPALAPATATTRTRKRSADEAGDDGEADPASADTLAGPRWLALARAEIGVKEWAGKKHNPRVLRYYVDAGHPEITADEVSWCAAFVCAMLERSFVASPKTLAARGFEQWGRAVTKPYPGCIVVFWRGSPKSWQGHVGFYVGETDTHVLCLGGNQSDGVSIAKMPKRQLLGYREPRPLSASGTMKGAAVSTAGAVGAAGATVASVATETVAPPAPVTAAEPGTLGTVAQVLEPLSSFSRHIAIACAVLAAAGAIWAMYHRYQIRKETGR